ncbi:hypothetical protein LLG95_07850 [bacterium]|nr:hypothetical protein [bacterium]
MAFTLSVPSKQGLTATALLQGQCQRQDERANAPKRIAHELYQFDFSDLIENIESWRPSLKKQGTRLMGASYL